MATSCYYGANIESFNDSSADAIRGILVNNAPTGYDKQTLNSFNEEIKILKSVTTQYFRRGSVYLEYNIPRMGNRADVILLIDGVVFVIEFKTGDQHFTQTAVNQVWGYALDLKNFQIECRGRAIVPILLCPDEKATKCVLEIKPFKDNVYQPLLVNKDKLADAIELVLHSLPEDLKFSSLLDDRWAKGGYDPTPTIIEAAIALYEHHTVEDITKHTGDVKRTSDCLNSIIDDCCKNKKRAICFITGVPGSGKTLIGLQTAIQQFDKEKAIYLSGNYPLVEVLQEALSRDYVKRKKEEFKRGEITKAVTKKAARSEVKSFIQIVHHFVNQYLQGTRAKNGKIEKIPGYFESNQDKAYVPTEHIAIFDEAQRAWTHDEMFRFMKEKKHYPDFPYSEPEYLISCMDRHDDWGLIICLIGEGQQINKGEAGIVEWLASINRTFKDWEVFLSPDLTFKTPEIKKELTEIESRGKLNLMSDLHLSVSMRSFRAEKLSQFVHNILERNQQEATRLLAEIPNYPVYLTRSLDTAKAWLREHHRANERMGLLASAKAERLKAININVRYQPDFVHWFLEDEPDIRSSNALEDTLTEFKVQGLEIDWACVAWDADLRYNSKDNTWNHWQLRSGSNWQRIKKPINQDYQVNAYRVLLTRARQGMIILVPNGDDGVPPDETRKPEMYDQTYNYLRGIGIPEI